MKKKLLLSLLLVIQTVVLCGYEVSTTVQKKRILLEEFTGAHCVNCPAAHVTANALLEAQPENAYVIAIHSGDFAVPQGNESDFRIDEGELLDAEMGAYKMGYPCGMVNRHVFSGSSLVSSRSSWVKYGKKINEEYASANLHLSCEFDGNTKKIAIVVQGFYMADIDDTAHFLNIAWTQSNIKGSQVGADMGNNYVHNHMLRGYVTPLWGDKIDSPKKGEYFERKYVYSLPTDVNGVEVKVEDVELVAFLCVDKKEVLNAIGAKPTYINYSKPLVATILKPAIEIGADYGYNFFEVKLKNESDMPITTAGFKVTINENVQHIEWNGNIPSFEVLPVTIKLAPYNIENENKYEILLTSVNGTSISGNSLSGQFEAPVESTADVHIEIQTDLYADENVFAIKDQLGNIIKQFGPYETNKKKIYKERIELDKGQIYCFEIMDKWGDGMQQPPGYYKIYADDVKTILAQQSDILRHGSRSFFRTSLPSAILTQEKEKQFEVVVDPTYKKITLSFLPAVTGHADVFIYSMTGNCLLHDQIPFSSNEVCRQDISVASIPSGIYILKIRHKEKEELLKLLIH